MEGHTIDGRRPISFALWEGSCRTGRRSLGRRRWSEKDGDPEAILGAERLSGKAMGAVPPNVVTRTGELRADSSRSSVSGDAAIIRGGVMQYRLASGIVDAIEWTAALLCSPMMAKHGDRSGS